MKYKRKPRRKLRDGLILASGVKVISVNDDITNLPKNLERRAVYYNCLCPMCGKQFLARSDRLNDNSKRQVSGCRKCVSKTKVNNTPSGENHPDWIGRYGNIRISRWNSAKKSAIRAGKNFYLSINDADALFELQNGKCALSGVDLDYGGQLNNASLDRIDSRFGYHLGNIQWVHKDINQAKYVYDINYFKDFCFKVANYSVACHA
jgi:predicted RNA-binding Zn-ribbon protein involved in translation (DUF1610 family)